MEKQMGYDDPTRKKLSELDIVYKFKNAFSLMTDGLNELESATHSFPIDEITKKAIKGSSQKIIDELIGLDKYIGTFLNKMDPKKLEPIDKTTHMLNRGNGFSMNESTYSKIDSTIKRIIEVNKKLNNGTKFK